MDTNNSSLAKNSDLDDFWKKLDPGIQKIVAQRNREAMEEKRIDLFLEGLLKRARENKVTIGLSKSRLSMNEEEMYFKITDEGECGMTRGNACCHEWTGKDITKAVSPGCLYRDILSLIALIADEKIKIEVF